jgi:butyryl-CoA dehydrogenase
LTLVGHGLIAWMWLQQALIAARALPTATANDPYFYQGKITACQFFFRYELPPVQAYAELLKNLDDTTLAMTPEAF